MTKEDKAEPRAAEVLRALAYFWAFCLLLHLAAVPIISALGAFMFFSPDLNRVARGLMGSAVGSLVLFTFFTLCYQLSRFRNSEQK